MPVKPPSRTTVTVDVHTPPRTVEGSTPRNDNPPRMSPDSSLSDRVTWNTARTAENPDIEAITPVSRVMIDELVDSAFNASAPAQPAREKYRIAPSVRLPEPDANGLRIFKGRLFVDTPDGAVHVALDPELGLYRARLMSERTHTGPTLVRDVDSTLWYWAENVGAMTYPLTASRLEPFRTALDFTGIAPDGDGLHRQEGKLFAVIDNRSYRVMHDLDASSPKIAVMRIVHGDDPVAADPNNIYVATRPGRSEPVFFHDQTGWVGLTTGGAGGMQPNRSGPGRRSWTDRLNGLFVTLRSPRERAHRLYPSMSREELNTFIGSLDTSVSATLTRLEAEYTTLEKDLDRWVRAAADSFADTHNRRRMANLTLGCWRRETGREFTILNDADLPPMTAQFPHVQKLELFGINRPGAVDSMLALFPGIERLTIVSSPLNTVPASITGLRNLTVLILKDCSLRLDAPGAARIDTLGKLQRLTLANNPLGVLPDFSNMPDLKYLDLSHTQLNEWPAGLNNRAGMEHLDLRFNKLSQVPETLLNPPAEQLEAVAKLNGVTFLEGNPFPDGYWKKFDSYWERLELARPDLLASAETDAFEGYNPDLFRMQRLYPEKTRHQARQLVRKVATGADPELSRRAAQFQALENQLDDWYAADGFVTVSSDGLHHRPAAVGHKVDAEKRLLTCWRREAPEVHAANGASIGQELDLSNLSLDSLPDLRGLDFGHVGSLKLSNMTLSDSPENFLASFRHIRWLDMANNRLRVLPPAIAEMPNLTRLALNNNQIVLTKTTAAILSGRKTLKLLSMHGNPLNRDAD